MQVVPQGLNSGIPDVFQQVRASEHIERAAASAINCNKSVAAMNTVM